MSLTGPEKPPSDSAAARHVPPHFSPRLPAQWESPAAIWVAWPAGSESADPRSDPGGRAMAEVSQLRLIDLVARSTDVKVLVGQQQRLRAAHLLADALSDTGRAELIDCEFSGDPIHDFGPTFVRDASVGRIVAVAWDELPSAARTKPGGSGSSAARAIANSLRIPLLEGGVCLVGGALETDGGGRLIVTPQSSITDDRNPGKTKEQIAQQLHQILGATEIVWLDGGGIGRDRIGNQVSLLARFVDAENVVVSVCQSAAEPDFENLESNYRQLKLWGSATKPHVNVHRLAIPPQAPIGDRTGTKSYCDFLMLGRDRLLLPRFGHPVTDDAAAELLAGLLPATQIIPVERAAIHSVAIVQPTLGAEKPG